MWNKSGVQLTMNKTMLMYFRDRKLMPLSDCTAIDTLPSPIPFPTNLTKKVLIHRPCLILKFEYRMS